jgi:hypothetical protein
VGDNGGGGDGRLFQMIYLDTILYEVIVLEPITVKNLIKILKASGVEEWEQYTIVIRY